MTNDAHRSLVVIGGGIAGLAAAHRALRVVNSPEWTGGPVAVTVLESSDRLGGKIRGSYFAGINGDAGVDEAADAYLSRVPDAVRLAREVGLGDHVTTPEPVHAAVMHGGLHPIPEGLVLGVPSGVMSLARSPLMSWRGKLRAALEPVLPSRGDHHDSIGRFVRARFGDEVHELLVDPLVGGIYASDTDRFSLAMVPQLADLSHDRSVLLAARRRAASASAARPATGHQSIFETPLAGVNALVEATRRAIVALGGDIRTSFAVRSIRRVNGGYVVSGENQSGENVSGAAEYVADAVIVATPGHASRHLLADLDDDAAREFGATEHSSVVMITVKTAETAPQRLRSLSGYLVPKRDQERVTAVSFGSNKWAHWAPVDGTMVMRISLGRDGAPTHDLIHEWTDEQLVTRAVDEVARQTGFRFTPADARVSRWGNAFPQYRPGHAGRMARIERRLAEAAPRVRLAGASVRGIGIPACIAQGENAALAMLAELGDLRN